MMKYLKDENTIATEEIWQQILDKMDAVIKRTGSKIPYTTKDGIYEDEFVKRPYWWTNGFWGGILALMYQETGDPEYLRIVNGVADRMDEVFQMVDRIHHDVGFMWYLSSGPIYRLTKDDQSRTRLIRAANYLTSRYNHKGGYIIAWNGRERQGWSIIDSMMNIPLLFFASEETGYSRYRDVAVAHADKTLENFIRPDGSVDHIVVYDPETGQKLESLGGQGYGPGSSWSRGQSWAINGFAQAYGFTGEAKYLDAAKMVAHYFITCVQETDYVPLIDFRSPEEPLYIDTTAGAIAASGLLDIAAYVPDYEKRIYINAAVGLIKALLKEHADLTPENDYILDGGSEAYHGNRDLSIIYGDYYLIETMIKLRKLSL